MIKRALSILLCAAALSALCFCSASRSQMLVVDETPVSQGVFIYFADAVAGDPKSYGLKKSPSAKQIREKAAELCSLYTAAKKLMAKNGQSLEYRFKQAAAQSVNSLWSIYSKYYKSLGMSKADLTEVETYEQIKQSLVLYYYGENGRQPVEEIDIKQKFVELYIGFKGFECRLTKQNANGEIVDMTEKEKQQTEAELRQMANRIDEGEDIDDVYEQFCLSRGLVATQALEVSLTKENDPMYDDDFFSKMSTISHGRAAIVKTGKSIYVVQRTTIASDDDETFALYRSQVLSLMKMPQIEKKLEKLAAKYEVVCDEERLDEIVASVLAVRGS